MGILSQFIRSLPLYLLTMPVMLMALSIHESAHGYAAYKLGDPTAHNLGRITLNPVKHFDLFGFLSMLIFHIGWAKPVPIFTRNFRNPRRDMAITGAAGPLSNLALAILHLLILRIVMFCIPEPIIKEAAECFMALATGEAYVGSLGFTVLAIIVFLLYMGVVLNVMLAIFNLIPIPPFDGSRIFYAFLPPKLYFGVMKYERYIMIAFIFLFFLSYNLHINPLSYVENWITQGLFTITGMGGKTDTGLVMNILCIYTQNLLLIPF